MSILAFFAGVAESAETPSTLTPPYNAPEPLVLPRVYGHDSATHPAVIDLGVESAQWIAGHRFWMAYTPFPPAEHENPSVLHSHDGKTWTTPTGLVNPIEDRSGAAYNGYNSDTDIIYDPVGKRIGVIWRAMGLDLPDGGYLDGPRLHMKWSSDGTTWTERLNVIDSLYGVSPALVRDADGTWVMFLGNDAHIYRAAEPTGPWTPHRITSADYSRCGDGTKSIWHLDVIRHRGQYRALIRGNGGPAKFYPGVSENGIDWRYGPPIMGSVYGWEMGSPETPDAMYRGTFTPHENGADYRVWYGAAGTSGWRIGYCDVPQKHWTDLG